jgi:DNA-binding response OmpR family regulator
MSKQRILIVEDEEFVQALLSAFLAKEGFITALATTGKQMFAILDKDPVDLILLDLSLPDEDGLTLTRQIRARSSVPIIVLTARRGREDRLMALEMGANDYLLKPMDPEELVLRVRNMLNRPGDAGEAAARERDNLKIAFDGWTLDITSHRLIDGDGKDVMLTRAEFNLLAALVRAPNRVLTRDFLLDAISRHDEAPTERVIDVLISRLRKKIESNPRQPTRIVTVLGCGYKFVRDGR